MKQSKLPPDILAGSSDWVAEWEDCPQSKLNERVHQIRQQMVKTIQDISMQLHEGASVTSDPTPECVHRVWLCLKTHWERIAKRGKTSFESVLGELCPTTGTQRMSESGIVHDVVFAQAMQDGQAWAAERFDREYMPLVRAIARRVGGKRAMDRVDNFAAELILTRDGRPPRIASYQGRTSLKAWLRSVVANFCISDFRKQREVTLEAETKSDGLADRTHCETLLGPVFRQVVEILDEEDRVLIAMLILDNVPQKNLAASLGINSGNVTRRRQRIMQSIWDRMSSIAARTQSEQSFVDCLDLILTGRDRVLRERLSEVLASGFRQGTPDSGRAEA